MQIKRTKGELNRWMTWEPATDTSSTATVTSAIDAAMLLQYECKGSQSLNLIRKVSVVVKWFKFMISI
jgi:hypothetical protein